MSKETSNIHTEENWNLLRQNYIDRLSDLIEDEKEEEFKILLREYGAMLKTKRKESKVPKEEELKPSIPKEEGKCSEVDDKKNDKIMTIQKIITIQTDPIDNQNQNIHPLCFMDGTTGFVSIRPIIINDVKVYPGTVMKDVTNHSINYVFIGIRVVSDGDKYVVQKYGQMLMTIVDSSFFLSVGISTKRLKLRAFSEPKEPKILYS